MKVQRHINFEMITKHLIKLYTLNHHINNIHQTYKHNQVMYTNSPFSSIHNIHQVSPMHININSHIQV